MRRSSSKQLISALNQSLSFTLAQQRLEVLKGLGGLNSIHQALELGDVLYGLDLPQEFLTRGPKLDFQGQSYPRLQPLSPCQSFYARYVRHTTFLLKAV